LQRRDFLHGMLANALAISASSPIYGKAAIEQDGFVTGELLRRRMDLCGAWQFRVDSEAAFSRTLQVPGCWQAQGVGERSGILRHDYEGTGWYQRDVPIPESWKDKRVVLRIGGALRITEALVNGIPAGRHDGLSAPFAFDISGAVRPGDSNTITLKISNPGNRPAESPDVQVPSRPTGMLNYVGNWGGVYGPVELETTGLVWIDDLWVHSNLQASTARFVVEVRNSEDRTFRGELRIAAGPYHGSAAVEVPARQAAKADAQLSMPGAHLWSCEHPNLYTASVSLLEGAAERDRVEQRFGLREITTQGNVLLLNGKPLYLRGYGDDDVEVLTGVPPASKEVYLQRLGLARSFGFNAVRFHSMTPVREFFEAADEVGIFVLAELPVVYTYYLLPFKGFVGDELTSVVHAHKNHPSWLSLAMGNELNPEWVKGNSQKQAFHEAVDELYRKAKSLMPDRLVMATDGYPLEPTDMMSTDRASPNHPTICHEFGGYYCTLPDPALIPKFTGVMIPEWLEAKQRWVVENGLASEYATYVRNSEKLVRLGRRFEIERVRRDANITGYEYWLIVDYPGGTGEGDSWEEGWFDYFWQPKGVAPEEGREINDAVLPLIDAGPGDRTLWADGTRELKLLVSNYGENEIRDGSASWRGTSNGRMVAESQIEHLSAPLGKISPVAGITLARLAGDAPQKLELVAEVDGHVNRWNFWVFPRQGFMSRSQMPIATTASWPHLGRYYPFIRTGQHRPIGGGLFITDSLDGAAVNFLHSGGRVWLALDKQAKIGFFPASGGALGTVVRDHPALRGFPQEGFCDLHFYSLMESAAPFPLDGLRNVTPIIDGIRTKAGFLSKTKDLSRVGYVFEAKVGTGRLLVTSLRLGAHLDDQHPEAVFLFDRLLRYCDSDEFQPRGEIPAGRLSNAVSEYLKT
jgi:beta-galactosidase